MLIFFFFVVLLGWIYALDKIIVRSNIILPIPENWRPMPEKKITVRVKLKQPSLIRFTLFNVSSYRGSSLNEGDSRGKDFFFVNSSPLPNKVSETSDGYRAESVVASSEAQITLQAVDGAAYARLKVEYFEGGEWKPCQSQSGADFLTIPIDKNNNLISDAWEKEHGLFKKTSDPNTELTQSGLTVFDAYRGIETINGWTDINPQKRAIFINNQDELDLSELNRLGFVTYLINKNQSSDTRIIDKNGSASHYGLYLTKSPKDDTATYYALNLPSDARNTAETEKIIVNSDLISAHAEILQRLQEINAKNAKKLQLNEGHIIARQIAVATGLAKSLPVPKQPNTSTLGELRKDFEAGYYSEPEK